MSHVCLAASLVVRIDPAQLLCCELWCLGHVWADQSDEARYSGGKGTLKRQELKPSVSGSTGQYEITDVFWVFCTKVCKSILWVTPNKIANLKINVMISPLELMDSHVCLITLLECHVSGQWCRPMPLGDDLTSKIFKMLVKTSKFGKHKKKISSFKICPNSKIELL